MAAHFLSDDSFGQNVVGSTNVGALPLLSKIGKVRYFFLLICWTAFSFLNPVDATSLNLFSTKMGSVGEREERLAELTKKFEEMMEGKVSFFA